MVTTKVLPDVGPVKVQTHVVVVLPPTQPDGPPTLIEGHSTVAQAGRYLDSPGAYLKVVSEWICPDCNRVHADQMDTDPATWEC